MVLEILESIPKKGLLPLLTFGVVDMVESMSQVGMV